tara:strand:+ start:469 stop:1470 length:1002 start_codon:yes stop_codon:yes gene_type:complete
MKFLINGKTVDSKTGPYIIAEIGINHNGDFDKAMILVEAAAKAGASAVKFQTYQTAKLVSSDSEYIDLLRSFELLPEQYFKLFKHAQYNKIDAFSACFDEDSAEIWNSFNTPAFKVASGDITHHRLLQKIAGFNKPLIISTGASSMDDIRDALDCVEKVNPDLEIALMHCVSKYPTLPGEANLECMKTLSVFGKPVGFSDHTEGLVVPLAAVARGALLIEKHFTLNKDDVGPDHKLSADPHDMSELVRLSRVIVSSAGDGVKALTEGEATQTAIRRSITLSKSVVKGQIIDENMLETTRPATGVSSAKYLEIIGKKARNDFEAGFRIRTVDVE